MSYQLVHNSLIAAHILGVIAWMAGLLYLPRLFIYHTTASPGSEMDKTFQVMESRLLRGIMNPAMIVVWLLGVALIWWDSRLWGLGFLGASWMSTKFAGGLFLTGYHMYLARARKAFARGERLHSGRFWRFMNEAPAVVAIIMVVAIVTKFGDGRFGG